MQLTSTTELLSAAMAEKDIDLALSNSVKYLDMFGNIVIAWTWLKLGLVAEAGLANTEDVKEHDFYHGKLHAMQYFYRFELPEIYAWAALLSDLDDTCYAMQKEWF